MDSQAPKHTCKLRHSVVCVCGGGGGGVCVCVCVWGGGNSMPRGYVARVIGVNNRHHSFAVTYCYPRF